MSFKSYLHQVQRAIDEATREGMEIGIENMRGLVVRNLKQQGHGRIYRIPGPKRDYTASAPGEYPAVRLAILSGPGGVETKVSTTATGIEARIGSRHKFGLALEKKPPSKGGRRWLKRTYDEDKAQIHAGFEAGFSAAMKKRGL